jgi:hypothetical protein
MSSKSVLLFSAMAVFSSLMLTSTTHNGLSNTFEVNAANNCDSTSTCNNVELLSPNNQDNNCRSSICDNFANGF